MQRLGLAFIKSDIGGIGTARQLPFQQGGVQHRAGENFPFRGVQKRRWFQDTLALIRDAAQRTAEETDFSIT